MSLQLLPSEFPNTVYEETLFYNRDLALVVSFIACLLGLSGSSIMQLARDELWMVLSNFFGFLTCLLDL
jgi:hypothetical protein